MKHSISRRNSTVHWLHHFMLAWIRSNDTLKPQNPSLVLTNMKVNWRMQSLGIHDLLPLVPPKPLELLR